MQHLHAFVLLQFSDKPRDTRGSNETTVSLGNNAAMPVLFAGLLEKTNSWMECLLSDGALLEHPVCSVSRPQAASDDNQLQRRQFWGRIFDEATEDTDLVGGAKGAYPLTRNLGPLPSSEHCVLDCDLAPKTVRASVLGDDMNMLTGHGQVNGARRVEWLPCVPCRLPCLEYDC